MRYLTRCSTIAAIAAVCLALCAMPTPTQAAITFHWGPTDAQVQAKQEYRAMKTGARAHKREVEASIKQARYAARYQPVQIQMQPVQMQSFQMYRPAPVQWRFAPVQTYRWSTIQTGPMRQYPQQRRPATSGPLQGVATPVPTYVPQQGPVLAAPPAPAIVPLTR